MDVAFDGVIFVAIIIVVLSMLAIRRGRARRKENQAFLKPAKPELGYPAL
jgi:preprotein translocase subunit YajC